MKVKWFVITPLLLFLLFVGSCKREDPSVIRAYFQIDPANPQSRGYNEALELFQELYPEVKLKIEYGTGEGFHQKLQTMVASKQMPDLFTTYVGKRTAYVTETGMALDLRPYIDESFKERFIASAWEEQGANGEIYTVPPNLAVCHTVYVNRSILNELNLTYPESYEQLVQQIPAIRSAGYYPVSMGNKDPWVVNSWLLSPLVHRLGGKQWLDKARAGLASFTDPPFVTALSLISEMTDMGLFSPGVNQMSNTEADQEFYQGKSVYLIDAAWRSAAMVSILDSETLDSIEMRVFPAIPGERAPGSSVSVPGEGFGISAALAGSSKADLAWKWIEFYTGEEGASIRLRHGQIPTYRLNYDDFDMPALIRQYAEFTAQIPMGYVIDSKMDPEGMTVLNPDIQAMMFRKRSPGEVAARYEQWVSENDSGRG